MDIWNIKIGESIFIALDFHTKERIKKKASFNEAAGFYYFLLLKRRTIKID
jgi:hypothetical protein